MFPLNYKLIHPGHLCYASPFYLDLATLIFTLTILVLTIIMLLIVLRKKILFRKIARIVTVLEPWMMDIILESTNGVGHIFTIPADIQLLLQNDLAKQVLVRELVKAKKSLSGISGWNLEQIYNQLGLHEVSLLLVQSKSWHKKAKGIQELAIMNQSSKNSIIAELTNHQDPMVRMEAQTALVRLHGYKGLYFFDTLTHPLSEWHQINLLSLLAHQPITGEDGIINWLSSSNDSVVQFSLKLIGEQHAAGFEDDVVKSLQHTNGAVRREAVLCLGQMPSMEAATALSTCYASEPEKNIRLCILHEFRNTGSVEDLPFLESLQYSEDCDIKLEANKTVLYLQRNITSGVLPENG